MGDLLLYAAEDAISSERYELRVEDGGTDLLVIAAGDIGNIDALEFVVLSTPQIEKLVVALKEWLEKEKPVSPMIHRRQEKESRTV